MPPDSTARKVPCVSNSGTLGGMPYDPETSGRRLVPYGASVLYYTATVPRRLLAVDELAVHSAYYDGPPDGARRPSCSVRFSVSQAPTSGVSWGRP